MRRTLLHVLPVITLLGALVGGGSSATATPHQITVGPNVNVSKLVGNQAETAIAINPTNPQNIAILTNVQFGDKLFFSYSTDGGTTWNSRFVADGTDELGLACCDPSLSWDAYGNLFMIYLDSKAHDVLSAISVDGGATFTSLGAAEAGKSSKKGAATKVRMKGGPGVDQPTVTTGPGGVFVTYKLFAKQQLVRVSAASVTGLGEVGAWGAPEAVPGSKRGTFGDITVGPGGQVMVTYQDQAGGEGPSTLWVNLDPDGLGPDGFGPAIAVTETNVGGFDYIAPQASRSVDAEVAVAYDRSGDAYRGRVYMLYTNETPDESDNTDIHVRHSDDDGSTWSAAVKVNDDATTNSQFNPHISIDQTTGFVAVSFHDARKDLGNGGIGDTNGIPNDDAMYYGAVSRSGGARFSANVRIAAGASNGDDSNNGVEYGDYTGMSFYGGAFYPAWADNSNSTGDNPDGTLTTFDIYTSKVSVT
jgi:hypothetical protein